MASATLRTDRLPVAPRPRGAAASREPASRLELAPLAADPTLSDRVYDALKEAVITVNLHPDEGELRLDERELAADLGVSRTPIREAITRLQQEGFVRIVQRRGVYVVRKTEGEVVEMIQTWAALESMAARLATQTATDADLGTLRDMFATFENEQLRARIDEYSETNIRFHQRILSLGRNGLIVRLAENLFAHMRAIRNQAMAQGRRLEQSIVDHRDIIEAMERRDTEAAERLVRQHTLELAAHVARSLARPAPAAP